ncbi:hypothetical protein SISNIDRAFT_484198 [Sistotremastrum niveocremeum HHB9708]|uniref:Uncharacterized protein n=1 Tax=Sistotremastrum niveocremeum HHB9708 TaxID=1314777 RepID=A0A164WTF8_9AGAM|nr:hypothetical protein SISNIDRAFT_484198 [Sistotremastrum niveocremeum HHB9708]
MISFRELHLAGYEEGVSFDPDIPVRVLSSDPVISVNIDTVVANSNACEISDLKCVTAFSEALPSTSSNSTNNARDSGLFPHRKPATESFQGSDHDSRNESISLMQDFKLLSRILGAVDDLRTEIPPTWTYQYQYRPLSSSLITITTDADIAIDTGIVAVRSTPHLHESSRKLTLLPSLFAHSLLAQSQDINALSIPSTTTPLFHEIETHPSPSNSTRQTSHRPQFTIPIPSTQRSPQIADRRPQTADRKPPLSRITNHPPSPIRQDKTVLIFNFSPSIRHEP